MSFANIRLLASTVLLVTICRMAVCQDTISKLKSVADGSESASALIQTLVNSSPGHLQFPPGTYLLDQTIEIDLSKTGYLAISGTPATKIVMSNEGPAFRFRGSHFKSADPSGFSQKVWDEERMPSVTGVAIEGQHENSDGIAAIGTMQLTVSRVHLRNLRHGIHLIENNRNVIIESCHIYENRGVGIYYDDVNLHQSNIVGCHISYCDAGGIVSRRGNVRNIHISGCDIESNMAAEGAPTANVFIDCTGSKYGTAEVAITGCTIQHNDEGKDSANIRVIGATVADKQQREGHVTISGNVLSDVSSNIWLDACRGVTVVGNTMWMGFDYNIRAENCTHLILGSNNFDRNPRYAYGRSLEAKNRLLFRSCQDCTLTGTHVANVWGKQPALSLEDCKRFNVSGLTILDCDVGLKLERVTDSSFTGLLVRDDRPDSDSQRLIVKDSSDNHFDSSLGRK